MDVRFGELKLVEHLTMSLSQFSIEQNMFAKMKTGGHID